MLTVPGTSGSSGSTRRVIELCRRIWGGGSTMGPALYRCGRETTVEVPERTSELVRGLDPEAVERVPWRTLSGGAMTRGSVHGRLTSRVEPLANPTRLIGGGTMDSTLRTFRANLFAVWDHWVVQVPDASGVHALVMNPVDAEAVARRAIATMLEVDPGSFQVIVETA